jgi:ABC-2 type transport system ATP-binding protein
MLPAVTSPAVAVENLVCRYGQRVALRGISFSVAAGEIFGLLGPNGGGKTTLFRVLATLLEPNEGQARVFDLDVVRDSAAIRRKIGVVFQNQSLDRRLTAAENLMHQGHLYGLRGAPLRRRIEQVLERAGLADRRDHVVDTLSGGLRRRVELAKALLHQPELLLLDEPSTGVDPRARLDFWDALQTLRRDGGVTILLTTHLLEEADKCDRLAVLDEGRIAGSGTPTALKQKIGGDVIVFATPEPEALVAALQSDFEIAAQIVDGAVRFDHEQGARLVPRLMESLSQQIDSVTISRPTLEDVFIHMTGHRFDEQTVEAAAG